MTLENALPHPLKLRSICISKCRIYCLSCWLLIPEIFSFSCSLPRLFCELYILTISNQPPQSLQFCKKQFKKQDSKMACAFYLQLISQLITRNSFGYWLFPYYNKAALPTSQSQEQALRGGRNHYFLFVSDDHGCSVQLLGSHLHCIST